MKISLRKHSVEIRVPCSIEGGLNAVLRGDIHTHSGSTVPYRIFGEELGCWRINVCLGCYRSDHGSWEMYKVEVREEARSLEPCLCFPAPPL